MEQGLPQNKVTAVVQTRDGYLWAGTYNGLARFDGVRFTVFDDNNTPELRSRRITSLFEADDGTLWIGTESGDVSQYKDGHFSAVPLRANWSGGKIYAITADDAGDVWLLNAAGELARARDGKVLSPPSGTVTNVVSLARGRDGTVWVEREGVVSALKNGQADQWNCLADRLRAGFLRRARRRFLGRLQQRHSQMERWRMGRRFGRRAVGREHRPEASLKLPPARWRAARRATACGWFFPVRRTPPRCTSATPTGCRRTG